VEDENGFLLKPQMCMPYVTCLKNLEYTKIDGWATGDRNNVCMRYTTCVEDKQYAKATKTAVSDNVCVDYTACDPVFEYVLRKGNATSDNVCARKTRCSAESNRGEYELRPPVDSPAWNVLGSDAVCAPISTCPPGKYVYIQANDTSDVTCEFCPKGMYKDATMFSCDECPQGTFSNVTGATSCQPCTNCLAPTTEEAAGQQQLQQQQCPYANKTFCEPAFATMCRKDADATCMQCPTAEKGWSTDAWGLCEQGKCRSGWWYDKNVTSPWERCVKCTPNFYCPISTQPFVECEVLTLFFSHVLTSFCSFSCSFPLKYVQQS
jgi:hypothetical protein